MELAFALLLAAIIGITHFFGEEMDDCISTDNLLLVSFSAGFTISYFFMVLIPEIIEKSLAMSNISVLAGFALFYVLEDIIYDRESHLGDIKYDFKELHTLFITIYHVAIGMTIYFLVFRSFDQALLFFLPVLFHTAFNSLAIKEMHEEMLRNIWIKLLASFSTLIGVFLSYFFNIYEPLSFTLLGFVGGVFIYIVIHDALDPRRERPVGFLTGVIVLLVLLMFI